MRQIVALGGGGFSMESSPVLDDYIVSIARRPRPRVCFVPTASGDSSTYIVRFYRAFAARDCVATDLTFFGWPSMPRSPASTTELRDFVRDQDVIYVGGGNTATMLAIWKTHGFDAILRDAYAAGTVLAGVSAGMNCWFTSSVTDSYGPLAALDDGLGLIAASACPHYDGEVERRPCYHALVEGGFPAGYAADNGVGLHFVDEQLAGVVASGPGVAGYRVEARDGRAVETVLPARVLAQ